MNQDHEVIYIYALVDPHDLEVRYIGQSNNPASRYKAHLTETSNKQKHQWIDSLLSRGQLPYIAILSVESMNTADEMEKFWINVYRSKEITLFNSPRAPTYRRSERTGKYGSVDVVPNLAALSPVSHSDA